jgi:hypothetical protein
MRALMLIPLLPLILGSVWEKPADEWTHEQGTYSLHITDGIVPGLLPLLKRTIAETDKRIVAIELDSWGGDGDTGMMLADFVSMWDRRVVVINRCNSACSFAALVALGQGKLWVGPGASIGVHQVSDTATGDPDRLWTERAAKYLQRYGAPKAPLDAMLRTPPGSMTILHESQLIELGAAALPMGWRWWLFGESNE